MIITAMADNNKTQRKSASKKTKAPVKRKDEKIISQSTESDNCPSISENLLPYNGIDPSAVYAAFISRHNNFKDPVTEYMTDRELGEAIIATQGYLGPIALKHGVSVKGLRERVKKTKVLNDIFDTVKGLHIDSVEQTLMSQAIKGESWAVKMVLLGTDAKDRGYQPDRDEGVIDLGKILRQRMNALNVASDEEYETNDRKLQPPRYQMEAWRDKGYHKFHTDDTYDEEQSPGSVKGKTITVEVCKSRDGDA